MGVRWKTFNTTPSAEKKTAKGLVKNTGRQRDSEKSTPSCQAEKRKKKWAVSAQEKS